MTGVVTKAAIANAAVVGAVSGGGMLWWLDAHAAGLGALAALFGVTVALVFHVLHYREKRRHNKKMEDG